MKKTWIVAAILLAMILTALDMTIVGTAMPTIISDLHGVSLYSWVFSAYLLTSTTPIPVYGKLADIYGRKWVFLVGAGIFTFGSWLCGSALSMPELILFRAIQGLGAAGVLPVALTIVGDIFTLEQRGRVQGLFSGVWGLSAIVGPLAGADIVEHVNWRWVFYINLPVGILVMAILFVAFKETVQVKAHAIDWVGTLLLTGGATILMVGLIQNQWTTMPRIGAVATGIILIGIMAWWERRVKEPIMPHTLFRHRFILVANGVNIFAGMVMFGLISYVPMFAQGVWGDTPTGAGLSITPMLIGWPISAMVATSLIMRVGYRTLGIVGGSLVALGMLLVVHSPHVTHAMLGVGTFLVGSGLGFTVTGLLIGVQSSVPWHLRGAATSSLQFFRTIGGAIGVAIVGSVFNIALENEIIRRHVLISTSRVTESLLNVHTRSLLPRASHILYGQLLSHTLNVVFFWIAAFAILTFGLALTIPRKKVEESVSDAEAAS